MSGPGARPRVDVGIVSWNTRDLTVAAVGRLLDGSQPDVDLRVLVRDNGSDDGTAEALRERFPSVAVDTGDNVGFAAGVNRLLELSDAPWFVTLNSDAWMEPGALGRLLAAADRHPRAFALAPLVLRPDGTLEHSTHALPSLRLAVLSGFGGRWARGPRGRELCLWPAWRHDEERRVGWAVGAALLVRRSAVDEIGPLDASFFMYGEDLEWGWRAARQGWETWFVPDAVVRHVGNASGERRFGTRREQVAIRNARVVVRRYLGRPRAGLWTAVNAAAAVRQALAAVRDRAPDRARYWLRQLPAHLGRTPS